MNGDETIWTDEEGRERRRRREGSVLCPRCRCEVPLEAETAATVQGDDGLWRHEEYGPALGFCCGLLIADESDGCFAYEMRDE